jgi:transcriptional regulator GlxA family with amidase domain
MGAGLSVLALTGCGDTSTPPAPPTSAATVERQAQAFVEALKPRRAGKPVIAVVALNQGTETTDFLLTHAVLQRAGVGEVQAVAPSRGRVRLYPALEVDGVHDFAAFDRAHPAGADYVIIPAMRDDDDATMIAWLRRQAAHGARIVSVCAGALVSASAGFLDGRRFTTHWYYRKAVLDAHPAAVYVPNQRYVVDRDVASATGISASVPTMLALVEAIGGREKAQAVASDLGVRSWSPAHDSSLFGLDARRRWNFVLNAIAFWRHERWAVDVHDGIDDIALAFATDAWSRTGRVSVEASAAGPVRLRSGLMLVAHPVDGRRPRLPLAARLEPVRQLDRTLCEIAERFGAERQEWVRMELEYPGIAPSCTH